MATKRTARVLAAGTALLLIAGLAACGRGGHRRGDQGGSGPPIPTATPHVTTIHPTLTISGIIAPYQNVQLTSTLSEPAAFVTVNEGDHVYRGEVIASLDVSDLQAQYESDVHAANSDDQKATQTVYTAQQAISQGPDTVASARANLVRDQAQLSRDLALFKQGFVSLQVTQQDAATVRNDEAVLHSASVALQTNGTMQQGLQASEIASAREDAASARAQARQIAAEIARATIASPVNGVVVNRNLNPGEYPGSRTIFVLQQVDPVYAELNASSANVFKVQRDAAVSLTIPGQNAAYTGRVVGVLGQVQPGSTNFTVKVLVPDAQGVLAAGLPVTGKIALPSATGIAIPTAAFLDDSHTTVMTDRDDTATLVRVHEVSSDGTTSIVTGLKTSDLVISNGQLGLTAGEDLGGP